MTATNHQTRIEGVVKAALLQAGFNESFGYYASPTVLSTPQGTMPAWLVAVFIRDGLAPEPIGRGLPIPGMLPPDDQFREAAQQLLEQCRQERDAKAAAALQAAAQVIPPPKLDAAPARRTRKSKE